MIFAAAVVTSAIAAGATAHGRSATWPKLHFDDANSGFDAAASGPTLRRLRRRWQVPLDGDVWSSAAVAGGRVFIGTEAGVEAVAAANGKVLWKRAISGGVAAAPTVSGGRVYAGVESSGGIYALDARTGRVMWHVQTGGENVYAAAIVSNGIVYAGAADGKLYAFAARNGATRWTANAPDEYGSPALVAGVLYTVGGSTLSAVQASSGRVLWQKEISRSTTSPLVHAGWIYLGNLAGSIYGSPVQACAPACAQGWKFQIPAGATVSPNVEGFAFTKGALYATGTNGRLYVFAAHTGRLRWQGVADHPIVDSPSIAAGLVWVGTNNSHLEAFRAAGCGRPTCAPAWTGTVGPPGETVYSTPAIAGGSVFVANYSHVLAAFADSRR